MASALLAVAPQLDAPERRRVLGMKPAIVQGGVHTSLGFPQPPTKVRLPKALYHAASASGNAALLNTPAGVAEAAQGGIKAHRGVLGPRPARRQPPQKPPLPLPGRQRSSQDVAGTAKFAAAGALGVSCGAAVPLAAGEEGPAPANAEARPQPPPPPLRKQCLFDETATGSFPPRPHLARALFDEVTACRSISAAVAAAAAAAAAAVAAAATVAVPGGSTVDLPRAHGGGGGSIDAGTEAAGARDRGGVSAEAISSAHTVAVDPYAWVPPRGAADADASSEGAPLPSMRPGTAQVRV
jgi:hypothetical protein